MPTIVSLPFPLATLLTIIASLAYGLLSWQVLRQVAEAPFAGQLAVVCDLLLVVVRRLLTPWQPHRQVALAQWPGLQRVALRRRAA